MHICISGAQGTGKSTLLSYLQDDPELSQEFIFRGNTTRSVKERGIAINEQGSDTSQLLVIAKHIENYTAGNVILDRGALDGLVYTAYLYEQKKVSKYTLRIAETVFESLKYDIIFFIRPEFEIEDDSIRSTDLNFRNRIVELFDEYMEAYNIVPVFLTGSIADRAEQVKEEIRQHQKFLEEQKEENQNAVYDSSTR